MQFIDYYYYEYQMAPSPFASFLSLLLGAAGIVACWLLFKKAGKPGWASIVPFYNVYTLFEITWGSGWRFLMLLIPIYKSSWASRPASSWPRPSARAAASRWA